MKAERARVRATLRLVRAFDIPLLTSGLPTCLVAGTRSEALHSAEDACCAM